MKKQPFFLLICLSLFLSACTSTQHQNLAFTDCRIILPDQTIDHGTLIIAQDRITYAGETNNELLKQPNQRVINAKGLTALPALINSHGHDFFNEKRLTTFMQAGIGSLCDLSPRDLTGFPTIQQSLNALGKGSRLFASTPIIAVPGGYGPVHVSTPEEARKLITDYMKNGVDLIKIAIEDDCQGRRWPIMSPEIAKAITAEAHQADKKVAAHVTHTRNLQEAIDCGVDIIAHSTVEPVTEELIKAIKAKDIIFIPTLELWKGVSAMYGLDYLENAVENIRRLNQAGVRIALGTDFAGFVTPFEEGYPQTEIGLMQQAGMSNGEIIRAATINARDVLGCKELGEIKAGMLADVLLVEGKPDQIISDLSRIKYMLINGKIMVSR